MRCSRRQRELREECVYWSPAWDGGKGSLVLRWKLLSTQSCGVELLLGGRSSSYQVVPWMLHSFELGTALSQTTFIAS